jgi:hypothetical protein
MLAPLTVLGGALAFDVVSYLGNGIQDYLRYWIVALPLGILLLGCVVAAVQTPPSTSGTFVRTGSPLAGHTTGVVVAVCLVLIVMIPTTLSTGHSMLNPKIGVEESFQIGFIFKAHPTKSDLTFPGAYPEALALGNYFASQHLPDGDVIVDNSTGCVPMMIVTSNQPKLFVIPNDRDFQRILADPITFHTHYIMEPNPAQAPVNAPNLLYPSLWATGGEFTKKVHQFPAGGPCPEFRLFKVLHHSNQVA